MTGPDDALGRDPGGADDPRPFYGTLDRPAGVLAHAEDRIGEVLADLSPRPVVHLVLGTGRRRDTAGSGPEWGKTAPHRGCRRTADLDAMGAMFAARSLGHRDRAVVRGEATAWPPRATLAPVIRHTTRSRDREQYSLDNL